MKNHEIYIELYITDFDGNPKIITDFTGIIPTHMYNKGINNRVRNSWKISTIDLKSDDLAENWR